MVADGAGVRTLICSADSCAPAACTAPQMLPSPVSLAIVNATAVIGSGAGPRLFNLTDCTWLEGPVQLIIVLMSIFL